MFGSRQTCVGTTDLTIEAGSNGIFDQNNMPVTPVFQGGSVTVNAVPEPGSLGVMGLGLVALCVRRGRRRD